MISHMELSTLRISHSGFPDVCLSSWGWKWGVGMWEAGAMGSGMSIMWKRGNGKSLPNAVLWKRGFAFVTHPVIGRCVLVLR